MALHCCDLIQQFNRKLDLNIGSDGEVNHLGTRESQSRTNNRNGVPRQLNVKYDAEKFFGERFQSDIGCSPSKKRRIQTPMELNSHTPLLDSFKLPLLMTSGSSFGRNGLTTSTMPARNDSSVEKSPDTIIGRSDIRKLDVMNNAPLGNKHVQVSTSKDITSARKKVRKVDSFKELPATKERPLNHEKLRLGVDIVEPMKCNEETKCVLNTVSMPPRKPRMRDKRKAFATKERPLDHEKLGLGVDIVEPMKCNEEIKCVLNTVSMSLQSPRKRNKRDVSLLERFTEEEIKLHIKSLMKESSQTGSRELCDIKDKPCQLCGDDELMFPPPPIYCSSCSRRIKDQAVYYIPGEELTDAQHQICSPCYNKCRSKFELSGITITKSKMLKMNNADNQISEEWVQCESCDNWQHQICGLYNMHKDIEETADYCCPYCLLKERESINNRGFTDNTDLGAKDLPETILSHFIEQRLFRRLKEERDQTAKATEKNINDVPEPEDLTLRVVFSADETSMVNKQFVDFLHKENYPSEFPYRSKVILLFQKVEGVDICIFALFVQEFGSECSLPNQRSTYIYYLDSVKYFKPERVTFAGEALRTFVYHEILIGYLEYCKLRGFTTSYIWACPPTKGDDYILYSHPKTQQTPDTKKLRRWYMSMLEKAEKQGVVTNVTNLYDRFFGSKEEATCNITAGRLPYLKGSFWSDNAELLMKEIEREDNDEFQKVSLSRRNLKGMRCRSTASVDIDVAKNILLMQKLGDLVLQNKEDVMVIDLHYSCTRCSKAILSGLRWFCDKCKNLQLCGRCYDAKHELPGEHIYNKNEKQKHQLSKAQVISIPSTTGDIDFIQENKLFESREAFLSVSQKNNYNFDSPRRAKHSSMMILHHLHTSSKHHFSQNSSCLTCTKCEKDVSKTIYFPCLICPDYRACTGCYTKDTMLRHLHIFPTLASANGVPPTPVMVLEILNAMSHACRCRPMATSSCSYPKCKEVKALFIHSVHCIVKDKAKCKICRKLLMSIRVHAFHCQDHNCPVPRCSDMKKRMIRKDP